VLVLSPCEPAARYDQDGEGDLVEVHVERDSIAEYIEEKRRYDHPGFMTESSTGRTVDVDCQLW
jgi:hypothetical protein